MYNDPTPATETTFNFHLWEICKHPDGSTDFKPLGTKPVQLDERGALPHCDLLLDWAIGVLSGGFHDLGLYYAEFCPTFIGEEYPAPALKSHHIAWQTDRCLCATPPRPARISQAMFASKPAAQPTDTASG